MTECCESGNAETLHISIQSHSQNMIISNLYADLSRRNSLTESCTKKCVPADYREGDLNKGESVCLDRCVSKFFDVNIKVSEKMQGEAANKQGGGMGMSM
jgi:hypothetical protein